MSNDLSIDRTFAAPRDIVWRAVTEHFVEWWCPQPWRSEILALDWKSGGRFNIAMHGPDGEVHGGDGMLLDVVPGERIVFTNMLGEGWTPQQAQPVGIVGMFEFGDVPSGGTSYRATARHWSDADRTAHAEMGFADGWGICADQLDEVATRLMTETNDA